MSEIRKLKTALVNELLDQIENGTKVPDRETGELERISTPASILGVAAKVVKDFQDEAKGDEAAKAEEQKLADFMAKRMGIRPAAPIAN